MRRIFSFLKSAYFLIGLGVVFLIALVLILGAALAWPITVQFLAIIGILLICVVALAVGVMRAGKNAALIEQSLKMQGQQQRLNTRPDRQPEIDELQKQFDAAIQRLKESRLGRGRSGKNALHALPWYMFIGPPGTGKTTAIANSGLNFPLGANRIRGVGGTRNCDWFFTDSAILLDTAGRYVTEHEDSEEWQAFLDILKKHRPGRPVNGIVVGISIETLAQASFEDVEWHASVIRERIDELLGRLGVQFPVYLLFTKCDLVKGFVEFFGEMSRKEREQIWGSTLEADQLKESDPKSLFEEEFARLQESLLNLRDTRLARAMKREDRRKVYVFPLEFNMARENLAYFVGKLFQPNPYQESPIFRGFYFTSGTQEGAPIDQVIGAVARRFDLSPTNEALPETMEESKSYFIKDLFTDVVIPDRYLARQTSRVATRGRMARAGGSVAALVVLVLFLLALSQAFLRSRADLNHIQTAAALVGPVRWDGGVSTSQGLNFVDALHENLVQIETRGVPITQLGLHRTGSVMPPARDLYFDRVRSLVEQTTFDGLRRRISSVTSRPGLLSESERDSLYSDLRAYLLLTNEAPRLSEEVNRRFLVRYSMAAAGRTITSQASAGDREAIKAQFERQALAFADGLATGAVQPFKPDAGVLAIARRMVYEPPSVQRVYERIKEEGEATLPPITLADALQGRYLELFANTPEVSGIFTHTGWDTYVKDAFDRETKAPDRVDWVMGYVEADLPASMLNQDSLASQLERIYFNEYGAAWDRFLRALAILPFRDMNSAARFLTDLGNSYDSPILYALATATNQTRYDAGIVGEVTGRLGNVVERKADQAGQRVLGADGNIDRPDMAPALHPLEVRFKRLHDFDADKAASGGTSPALLRALASLAEVGNTLNGLSGDRSKSADYVRQITASDGGELRSQIQTIESALATLEPQLRTALFINPIKSAWATVVNEGQAHLNDRWQEEVVAPYRAQIAGRYPLDAGSTQDVPVGDFERFFQPQTGTLATFWTQYLTPFMGATGKGVKTWEGRGIAASPQTINAYEQARRIGEGLYDSGVLKLDFELQPEIPDRTPSAPAASQVEIDIHGRNLAYAMGSYRPWTPFVWPARPGAALRLSTQEGPASVEFEGDWALFRMLQAANTQRDAATEYHLEWPFPNGVTVQYSLRTRSTSNPFANARAFFNFDLPQTL